MTDERREMNWARATYVLRGGGFVDVCVVTPDPLPSDAYASFVVLATEAESYAATIGYDPDAP